MSEKYIKNIEASRVLNFASLVSSGEGIVESRRFINRKDIKMTMVSLPQDEGINPYALPGDVLILILDGEVEVSLGEALFTLCSGECIVASAGTPHGIHPVKASKVLTIEVKAE